MRAKHEGFGRWVVLTDDEEQVFGPGTKAEAEAYIKGAPSGAPSPAAADQAWASEMAGRAADRAWQKKLGDDLRAAKMDEEADLRALLNKRHSPDEAEYILRQIMPIVEAGLQGGRRERKYIQPPKPGGPTPTLNS